MLKQTHAEIEYERDWCRAKIIELTAENTRLHEALEQANMELEHQSDADIARYENGNRT